MIKFPKEVDGNKIISHVTEYLGSHIFQLLGINAHDTLLGIYHGQEVIAAKDFVYDCGSCLFPRIKEEDLLFVTSNEKELDMRTYKFPTSQIKLGDEKSSYYEVIAGKHFEECTKQAKWLIDTISFNEIDSLIDGVFIISENRKLFLKKILRHRFQKIFLDIFDTI